METWQKGIWATAGIALFVLAAATIGTWYVATGTRLASLNAFVICWGVVAIVGMYLCVAAVGDWPLPGRTKARRALAARQKVEALRSEHRNP